MYFEQAGSMEDIDKLLSTPKKKKLTTTSQYIYRNLFQVRLVFNLNVLDPSCLQLESNILPGWPGLWCDIGGSWQVCPLNWIYRGFALHRTKCKIGLILGEYQNFYINLFYIWSLFHRSWHLHKLYLSQSAYFSRYRICYLIRGNPIIEWKVLYN